MFLTDSRTGQETLCGTISSESLFTYPHPMGGDDIAAHVLRFMKAQSFKNINFINIVRHTDDKI